MIRARFILAVVTAVAVAGATALATTPPPEKARTAGASIVTTTTAPDFAGLAAEGPGFVLDATEVELTEKALSRATTTTTSTTTTTVATTTTAQAPVATASKKPTTPTTQPPPPPEGGGFSSQAESEFSSLISSYRQSQGLGTLSRDGSLDSYARSWAKEMAERGDISHSSIGSLMPPWSSVGENVGVGGSAGSLFGALVDSSGHRANMLGDFTHMGIGVWRDSSGTLWTAHVFAR